MRVRKRLGTVLLGAALLLSLGGCGESGTATGKGVAEIRDTSQFGKTTTYNLQVIEPTQMDRTANLSLSPSCQLIKSVKSGNTEYRLKEFCVSRNDHVEAGQVIAVLQGLGSPADVELKRLEIEAYESNTAEMLAYYEGGIRAAEAMPQNTESQRTARALNIEYAKLEYEKYQLQSDYTLKGMQAQLASLEAAAGEVEICAPVTGAVKSIASKFSAGDPVPAGTELCRVYADTGMCFSGMSSNSAFVYGRELTLRVTKGKKESLYTGRVVSSPEVQAAGSFSSLILVELDGDPDKQPESEGTGEVTYTILADVYAVPKNAVTNRDGVSYVDVLVGDAVRTRAVQRGPTGGSMICILHGLHEGDQVVVSSYNS